MANTELALARQQIQQQRAELQQQQRENAQQSYLVSIYRKARNSHGQALKQCIANEGIRELNLRTDLFLEAVKRPDVASRFVWQDVPASRSDKQAEQRDRSAFTDFCKAQRFNDGVAGFNLASEILGAGNLTEYSQSHPRIRF